ncbi:MAG: type II secretion system GspH family protein [Planctomycetota bacterium]|jgi:prepilin-type N-terminal cleavage/methylation domain-containing protein|nr:type II secretion system GspH family protein [Planctomycetota bacterium]
MKKNRGFTLLEVTIVLAVVSVIFVILANVILESMRAAKREQAFVFMDQEANRALEAIKHELLSAYVPVSEAPLIYGRIGQVTGTNFSANVEAWRTVLGNGTDAFAFLVGLSAEGDGDFVYDRRLDEGRRLILGIQTPENSSEVPNNMWEATDFDETLVNMGILDLDPVGDLGLPRNNGGDLNVGDARFAGDFVFPAASGRRHVYAIMRFRPYRQDGQPVIVSEADVGQDLNFDQDRTDNFALGGIEIVYPNSAGGVFTKTLTSSTILLQLNRNDDPQNSLFQLWPRGTSGNTIRVHLLMCNYLDQANNAWAFHTDGYQMITRTYNTVLNMPMMSAE